MPKPKRKVSKYDIMSLAVNTINTAITKQCNDKTEQAKEFLKYKLGVTHPSKNDVLKAKLYLEQSGKCIYTSEPIDVNKLLDGRYCTIDHILPISKSGDNTYANKVLCLAEENKNKGDKTPCEWLGIGDMFEYFEKRVSSMRIDLGNEKVNNLLSRIVYPKTPKAMPNIRMAKHPKENIIALPKKKAKRKFKKNGKKIQATSSARVFTKNGKYYYTYLFSDRVITPGRKSDKWDKLDDNCNFLFTLDRGDIIELKQKNKDKIIGYYHQIDENSGDIILQNRNNKNARSRFSNRTIEYINKYNPHPDGYFVRSDV